MAQYNGSKRTPYDTFVVNVRPVDVSGGGYGDILLPDGSIMPWRSLGGDVDVHVGTHLSGTIREGVLATTYKIEGF